jgi:hypothetical protein
MEEETTEETKQWTDAFGFPLVVGDRVVFSAPDFGAELQKGSVLKFTAKRIVIQYVRTRWHWTVKPGEFHKWYSTPPHVVRVDN